jgi:hypothetical protein
VLQVVFYQGRPAALPQLPDLRDLMALVISVLLGALVLMSRSRVTVVVGYLVGREHVHNV